jgi:hypothetical protein
VITPFRLAGTSALFLIGALFYAPLAYGCTRPETLPTLFVLLGAAIVLGALGFLADKGFSAVPPLAWICVGAILLQGWWMTWNPVPIPTGAENGASPDFTAEAIHQLSFNSMLATSFLLGAFLVLCGQLKSASLARFVLRAAAFSGVLISVAGIVLKLGGKPLMLYFWKPEDTDWNTFAFYRYHANAGAFLNLVWPLILVFARRAYSPGSPSLGKIAWTLAAFACGTALLLNASKSALIIGFLVLPWPFLTWLTTLRGTKLIGLSISALLLVAAGLFLSSKLANESAFQRMTVHSDLSESADGRLEAYHQYLDTLPALGIFGVGPGLFQVAFPYQYSRLRNMREGLREYAHEDYLQTVIEWGWPGTLWWSLLVGGGLYRAAGSYRQRERFASKTDRHLVLAAMLGVVATLAQALVDFPLQIASIRLFFLLLLAFCWASPKLLAVPPPEAPLSSRVHRPR